MARRVDDTGDRRPGDRDREGRQLEHRRGPGAGRGRPQLPGGQPVDGPRAGYRLTKLLFDGKQALGEVHPSARRLELETAPDVAPLELHPGARRYYDEQDKT
jgi:hypothetical protein